MQWTVWFKCVNVKPIKRCIILTYTPFIKMKRKQFFTIFEEFMGQLLPHVHAMYYLTNHYLKTSKKSLSLLEGGVQTVISFFYVKCKYEQNDCMLDKMQNDKQLYT